MIESYLCDGNAMCNARSIEQTRTKRLRGGGGCGGGYGSDGDGINKEQFFINLFAIISIFAVTVDVVSFSFLCFV
jgi:hypothetical protein